MERLSGDIIFRPNNFLILLGYILSWTAWILFTVLNGIWAYDIGSRFITDDKFIAFLVGFVPLALAYLIVWGSISQAYEDAYPETVKKEKYTVKIINKDEDDQEFTCDTVETVAQWDHYKVIMNDGWVITHPTSSISIQENI